jgi:NADH-quinone oxidoreductase subunit G
MPTLTIDGIEVTVDPGTTVLQACEEAGKEIPRFCYHERLSIAGNCRMCLVEMERSPKPIASCAMPVGDGMVIHTNTPTVKKAREGVMEFLLINHPLDCPICDQGGECDLQDQAMAYGGGNSRYDENKRAVVEKDMGPLIKTIMTRCIHCTRCIRFCEEVAGTPAIGAINRGEHMEITTLGQAVASELSGNVIDLCPVGALTSKPYAFAARSWELTKTETIDAMDAVGSNIRVDGRGSEVMRVLPRLNEEVNEEWISDKTRFAYDGLKHQRLDRPYLRREGRLVPVGWPEALAAVANRIKATGAERIAAIAGDQACAESMMALKDLFDRLGSPHMDCRQDGAAIDPSCRAGYLFNSTIAGIDEADALLLIGSNPRLEAAVINARIRRRWLAGDFPVGMIGPVADLTYAYEHLGTTAETLVDLVEGQHVFADTLKAASRPMMIVGGDALTGDDGAVVLAAARALAESAGMITADWNGFNLLHRAAARVGGLDLGFVPGEGGRGVAAIQAGAAAGEIDLVYLLGADEIDMTPFKNAFVVYQGSHGDAGAHAADVVLSGAAYTEKSATWVNTEGRVQRGQQAVFPLGDAREDWTILRALSAEVDQTLPYDTVAALRRRMIEAAPHFAQIDTIEPADWGAFGVAGAVSSRVWAPAIADYYFTDPIARASKTMSTCSATFNRDGMGATGTDG